MKFYVDYEDKEGDLCHVWVNADSKKHEEEDIFYSMHKFEFCED